MKRLLVLFLLTLISSTAGLRAQQTLQTDAGLLTFKRGQAALGNLNLNSTTAFSGLVNVDLFDEDLWAGSGLVQPEKIMLLRFLANDPSKSGLIRGYAILDLRGSEPIISNAVRLEKKYVWGDNHYVKMDDGVLYFGLYVVDPFDPSQNSGGSGDRIQFIYRDRKLEVNVGKWMGPPKPERYIVPDESERGPCFNVANVPACIQEVERDEARKRKPRAMTKRAAPPSSAASR
jgi:hypothetical protein